MNFQKEDSTCISLKHIQTREKRTDGFICDGLEKRGKNLQHLKSVTGSLHHSVYPLPVSLSLTNHHTFLMACQVKSPGAERPLC